MLLKDVIILIVCRYFKCPNNTAPAYMSDMLHSPGEFNSYVTRGGGGAGVNHVKRDWLEIFNVNCDLYLFFCVKRDWGYLRET